MPFYRNRLIKRGMFSLLQAALVLTFLAVVASIVGPRISRAAHSPGHLPDQLLIGHLKALRTAISDYAADHAGRVPSGDATQITQQLTRYTDTAGATSATRTARHRLGPYLREIPPLTVGGKAGSSTIRVVKTLQAWDAAWLYDESTGQIRANTPPQECDSIGREYASY
jgi:hypothetical protein